MSSINDMIKDFGDTADKGYLRHLIRGLEVDVERGIITLDEARKQLQQVKDLQNYRSRKGMADGGEAQTQGIESLLDLLRKSQKNKNNQPPPDGTPLNEIPIEILLDPKSSIFGVFDKETKLEILRKMGIVQGAYDGGDVKKGIGSFLPRMSNGGILNSLSELMRALIFVESRGNPNAVSEAGAIGLTQVKVPTAMQPGNKVDTIFEIARKNNVDFSGETPEEARRLLFIPSLNVQFGEQYLQAMIKRFGNVNDGITAYNQGPKTMTEFIQGGRDPSILSQEGRDYLPKVLQAVGVEDFGFENIPPVAPEEQRTLGSVLPESFSMTGQEFLKSEDPINPVYAPAPQARPTELVDKLGLPGDLMRDAEIDIEMAMNPALVGRATMPPSRPEPEDDATLASSLLPPQRPFGTN